MGMHPFDIDLKEGESWDDKIELTITRETAASILAACVTQAIDFARTYENAREDAEQGNIAAQIVCQVLSEQIENITTALLDVSKLIKPDMATDLLRVRVEMGLGKKKH